MTLITDKREKEFDKIIQDYIELSAERNKASICSETIHDAIYAFEQAVAKMNKIIKLFQHTGELTEQKDFYNDFINNYVDTLIDDLPEYFAETLSDTFTTLRDWLAERGRQLEEFERVAEFYDRKERNKL